MKLSLITLPRKKTQVIQIECGVHENTLPANLPSRQFHAGTKTWRAPIVRLNLEYLLRNRSHYEATEEYWDMLKEFHTSRQNVVGDGGFSGDYPFKTKPRPHQLAAVKKLYPFPNTFISADIGTGKSKMAIDLASHRYYDGTVSKVLVIGLVSIKEGWGREIDKHCPVPSNIHVLETTKAGQNRYRRWLEEDGLRWLITGIESFSNGKTYDLCTEFIDEETMIIIDESDSIKNYQAGRTERCVELGEIAPFKLAMTGTPITQGIVDLFSQFEFLDSQIIGIGDFYSFRNRYAVMGGFGKKAIIGYQRVEELTDTIGKYVFQVRKRDVLTDLPESSYQEYAIEMSAEQKKLYKELKANLKLEYNGNKLTVASTINLMQRFSEITGGYYSYVDEEAMEKISIDENVKIKYKKEYLKTNPKLKELLRIIGSMDREESVVIWAVSKMEIAAVSDALIKEYGPDSVVQMHGGIDEEGRTQNLDSFTAKKARFLVGNQGVGGIGLNGMQEVSAVMIYFSNDFSMRKRVQSEGRIERIGQTRPMLFIDLVCKASIDMYILKALKGKYDFAEAIRAAFEENKLEELI